MPFWGLQAEAAAQILVWLTAARLTTAPQDIAKLRSIALASAPGLAGPVLMLGMRLITVGVADHD
jgi:hypothetical protein